MAKIKVQIYDYVYYLQESRDQICCPWLEDDSDIGLSLSPRQGLWVWLLVYTIQVKVDLSVFLFESRLFLPCVFLFKFR
jgi:hypothetical protein